MERRLFLVPLLPNMQGLDPANPSLAIPGLNRSHASHWVSSSISMSGSQSYLAVKSPTSSSSMCSCVVAGPKTTTDNHGLAELIWLRISPLIAQEYIAGPFAIGLGDEARASEQFRSTLVPAWDGTQISSQKPIPWAAAPRQLTCGPS